VFGAWYSFITFNSQASSYGKKVCHPQKYTGTVFGK
jgi:hypothetical protein